MKTLAKSIEMISWTEENGRIHPIKFKISTVTGEKEIYKIVKLYSTDLEKIAGNKIYKFTCEIILNNHARICELRYDLDSCKWVLFKL